MTQPSGAPIPPRRDLRGYTTFSSFSVQTSVCSRTEPGDWLGSNVVASRGRVPRGGLAGALDGDLVGCPSRVVGAVWRRDYERFVVRPAGPRNSGFGRGSSEMVGCLGQPSPIKPVRQEFPALPDGWVHPHRTVRRHCDRDPRRDVALAVEDQGGTSPVSTISNNSTRLGDDVPRTCPDNLVPNGTGGPDPGWIDQCEPMWLIMAPRGMLWNYNKALPGSTNVPADRSTAKLGTKLLPRVPGISMNGI